MRDTSAKRNRPDGRASFFTRSFFTGSRPFRDRLPFTFVRPGIDFSRLDRRIRRGLRFPVTFRKLSVIRHFENHGTDSACRPNIRADFGIAGHRFLTGRFRIDFPRFDQRFLHDDRDIAEPDKRDIDRDDSRTGGWCRSRPPDDPGQRSGADPDAT